MNLKKILTEETIRLSLKGETKQEIIEELLDIAVSAGQIVDRKAALYALMEREGKMSTGLQNGIAMPHAKTDGVTKLTAVMAVKKGGVEFQSIDRAPTNIFIMTLSPMLRAGPHIQFLAEISRLLSRADVREKIMQASETSEIIALFPD